jgi:hypothetical protein
VWPRSANNYSIAVSNKVLAFYKSYHDNATTITFKDGTALQTHQLICDLVAAYIQRGIKQNYSKIRKQKQVEFWFFSYQNAKHQLTIKQK